MRTGIRRAALELGRALVRFGAPGTQLALLHYPVDLNCRPDNAAITAMYAERAPAFAETLAQVIRAAGGDVAELPERNEWLSTLDALTLYGFLVERRPATYLEIGSGVSTMVARNAIRRHSLPTRLVSVDPRPRREIDGLCDEVIRRRLQDVDLDVLVRRAPGDVVFFDGTHQALPGTDVTVFVLEVLPNLPPGILVGFHDIYLPQDYPDWMRATYPSEQYLVAAWLLGGGSKRLLLSNSYVRQNTRLRELALAAVGDDHGVALWVLT